MLFAMHASITSNKHIYEQCIQCPYKPSSSFHLLILPNVLSPSTLSLASAHLPLCKRYMEVSIQSMWSHCVVCTSFAGVVIGLLFAICASIMSNMHIYDEMVYNVYSVHTSRHLLSVSSSLPNVPPFPSFGGEAVCLAT